MTDNDRHHVNLLSDALAAVLIAARVVGDQPLTGPELLLLANDYTNYLRRQDTPETVPWQPVVVAWPGPWTPADGSFWRDREGQCWRYDVVTDELTRRQLGMSQIHQPREYVQQFYGPMRSERRPHMSDEGRWLESGPHHDDGHTMTDDGRLRDFHARYHCEDGNLLGDDECGWERCPFWEVASVVVPLARADERAKCIAEIEALLHGFGENEITGGYEHGFNEGLARALDALREKEG